MRRAVLLAVPLLALAVPARADGPSLMAPAHPGGVTRVRAKLRPILGVSDGGGGALAELAVDHYFQSPWRLTLEIAPLALAMGDGSGSIGHFRIGGAYASEFVEIGATAGTRLHNLGAAGISFAAFLRLGAVDGLNLTVTNGYVWKRNRYTGRATVGLDSMTGVFTVPLSRRFALYTEGAYSSDSWMYASLGLRYRLAGEGRSGTWFLSGSLGLAWVLDRPPCPYPDTGWCSGSTWAAGPTIGLGIERRF